LRVRCREHLPRRPEPRRRDAAQDAALAAGMTYVFVWTNARGFDLNATYDHRHLTDRPRRP
jgi:hypothetical protein